MSIPRATLKVDLGKFGSGYGDSLNLSFELTNDGNWEVVAYGSPHDLRRSGTYVRLNRDALAGIHRALDHVADLTQQHGAKNPWLQDKPANKTVASLAGGIKDQSAGKVVDELERLASLLKQGHLSPEEFKVLKSRLL